MKRTVKPSNFDIESEVGIALPALKVPDETEEASYLICDDDSKTKKISPRAAIAHKIQQLSASIISQKSLLRSYSPLSPSKAYLPVKDDKCKKEQSQKERRSNNVSSNNPWLAYQDEDDEDDPNCMDKEKLLVVIPLSRYSICTQFVKKYSNRCTFILIGFMLSIIITFTILLTVIPCDTLEAFQMFRSPEYFILEGSDQVLSNKIFHVVLFGDSLIHKPFLEFDLGGKIQALLPQFHLQIKDCGFNAATINDLRTNKPYIDCVLSQENNAVILFWDSDVSNVDEWTMSETEVQKLREKYIENLELVIETIQDTGALLALAGPGILGESGKGLKAHKRHFAKNQIMLDAYTLMNQQVSLSYDIPYINVRFPFLNSIPPYQLCYSGNIDIHVYKYIIFIQKIIEIS